MERSAPPPERLGIVQAEVLKMHQSQIRGEARRFEHCVYGRQASAGKDVPLDEIDRVQVIGVRLVGHDDRLQHRGAIRFQKPAALGEEGIEIPVSNGFDRLDGNQFVEPAGKVAIIFEQNRDLLGQTGGTNPHAHRVELLLRNCGRRDSTAVAGRRMQRETAPARADLEQVIAGLQSSLRQTRSNFSIDASCSVERKLGKIPLE